MALAVSHPLLRRELRLLARDAGLNAALIGFLATMLAAGVLLLVRVLGSPGTRPPTGDSVQSGLLGLQWALSGLLAPWALTRLAACESDDVSVHWGALCAVHPWQIAGARLTVAWVYLLQLLVLPVPLLLIAHFATETSRAALLGGYVDLGCWLTLLAPAALLCQAAGSGVLARLGLSYLAAALLALARLLLAGSVAAATLNAVTLAAATGLVLVLLARSRRRLLYLGA